MGTQTAAVMVSFIALHITIILMVISISTPDWIVGDQEKNHTASVYSNTSSNDTRKGLWEVCKENREDECHKLDMTIQPEWFKSVQALTVCSTGGILASVVMTYIFFLVTRYNSSFPLSCLITFVTLLSAVLYFTALIIFGTRAKKDTPDISEIFELRLGWSYFVGVASVVSAMVSLLANGRETYMLKNRTAAYENI